MPRVSFTDNPVFLSRTTSGLKMKRKDSQENESASKRFRRRTSTSKVPDLAFKTINGDVDIDPLQVYIHDLQSSKVHFEVFHGQGYILADCDNSGKILKDYICVHKQLRFTSFDGGHSISILSCSCPVGTDNRERLLSLPTAVDATRSLSDFKKLEEAKYCLHCKAISSLYPMTETQNTEHENQQPSVCILRENPLLIAVRISSDIHLVTFSRQKRQLKCMTCRYGSSSCEHAETARTWLEGQETDVREGFEEPQTSKCKCISWKRVPYPLTDELKERYGELENGNLYPPYLLPLIEDHSPACTNGYNWDHSDPVERGWVIGDAIIYKEANSVTHTFLGNEVTSIKVCYRLCTGPCQCKLYYDGQEDLLFNLNNKDLVHYSLLLNYLHHMLEGKSPLAVTHRALSRNHAVLSNSSTLPIHKLRMAWNCFARLLAIECDEIFQCPVCGPTPDAIVCDATSLGVRKHYLKPYIEESPQGEFHSNPVQGSSFKDRTFLLNKKTRSALLSYATSKSPIPEDEFHAMIRLLKTEKHGKHLASFIQLVDNGHQPPEYTQQFLKDISRSSPVSSLVQSSDSEAAIHLLVQMGNGIIYPQLIEELSKHSPIISKWLFNVKKRCRPLPTCVYDIVLLIATLVIETYNQGSGTRAHIDTPNPSLSDDLCYFPSLPKLHRDVIYGKDTRKPPSDSCNKFSSKHPSLSPGIFTIFCKHQVCYGFELLTRNESPKHPFSIFKTRFPVPPSLIVYDNACKLHEYCLNREPAFFKNTIFCVDRMHWKNHTGCSSGYNLDTYKGRYDNVNINSQVNEQANAGLGRLKAQLSYMLPDNFIFHTRLFLALHNKDKINRLQ